MRPAAGRARLRVVESSSDRQASSARRELAAVGARLRHLREDAGLSGRELARRAGWHPSKVSRLEHGAQRPSVADIDAWSRVVGAREGAYEQLMAHLRVVDSLFTEWHLIGNSSLAGIQEQVDGAWERSRRFRFYSSRLVTTPAQTPDYARALLASLQLDPRTPEDLDDAVRLRMRRQDQGLADATKRFVVLYEESALERLVGTREIMAGQLGNLLTVGSRSNVSLGIVPRNVDRTGCDHVEEFFLYDDSQVTVELLTGLVTFTATDDVAAYATAFGRLARVAVHGAAARALITRAIERLDAE